MQTRSERTGSLNSAPSILEVMRVLRWAIGLLLALGAVAGLEAVRTEATSYSRVFRLKSPQAGPWFRIYRDGKWGYADRQGRMRLPARYDDVTDFFDGVAAVQMDDRWGYIDERGTFVIEPQFDGAAPFTGGLAVVRVDGQAGAIDRSGAFVIPPIYGDVFPSPDGGVIGHREDRYVVVGPDGHEITGRAFRMAQPFSEGLAAVCIDPIHGPAFGIRGLLAERSCGYVDAAARFVVAPAYGAVEPFAGGIARVWDAEHHAFGLIRRDGTFVRGFEFQEIQAFSEGLALARDRNGAGYLRTDGTFAFRVDTNPEGGRFSTGLAAVYLLGRFGFVDRNGRLAVRARYGQVREFSDGLAPVRVNDQWGYIDRDGRLVIPARFDDAEVFVDGLALARTGETWDYIDRLGRTIMHDVCDPDDVTPLTIC